MAFVVLYDACALYGNTSRDLLVRVAGAGLVQAEWTNRILDEVGRALGENLGISVDKFQNLRRLINRSVDDCLVES